MSFKHYRLLKTTKAFFTRQRHPLQPKQFGAGISPSNPDNIHIGNHIHLLTHSIENLSAGSSTFPLMSYLGQSAKVNHNQCASDMVEGLRRPTTGLIGNISACGVA